MVKWKSKYLKYQKKFEKLLSGGGICGIGEECEDSEDSNGNIDNFYIMLKSSHENIVKIGKGDGGTVYKDINDDKNVYKVSEKENICRKWQHEVDIYNHLNKYNIDTELCKLTKMYDFQIIEESICILQLLRVINPIDPNLNYTIHPSFNNELNYDMMTLGRGRFLGINKLIENNIIKHDKIKIYIDQLGTLIGRLQFEANCDTHDIEIFIGKSDKDSILYVCDFDMTHIYTTEDIYDSNSNYSTELLEKMAYPFIEYIPIDHDELKDVFLQSYYEVARNNNKLDLAKNIVKYYQEVVYYYFN
jgi:hypothetical protein